MKLGIVRSKVLTAYVSSVVRHMHILPKMNGTSLTQKSINVFYLAMEKKPKDTDCMSWKT